MAATEQFSLRWNNFHSNLTSGFHELLEASEMVDVTLAVEGHFLQAHKVVLSICSPYFKEMFKVNPCKHPIVILKDVGHEHMRHILQFMYMGEVNVLRENLSTFLRTAELLQVKGLTGDDSSETSSRRDDKSESSPDNDGDDSELMHFNQLIDSDVELPVRYSTPIRVPTPPTAIAPVVPTVTNKRQPKSTHHSSHNCSSSKRVKSENSSTKLSNVKVDNNESAVAGADEGGEVPDPVDGLARPANVKTEPNKAEGPMMGYETKDKVRQLLENNITMSASTEASQGDQGRPDAGKYNQRHAYQCDKCFKRFSRRDHLRTHEKNIHGEDAGPFVCAICSQLYKNTESLRKHIAKFHFPKINESIIPKVEVNA